MKYYSLNKKSPAVDFKTATINGQAPDKGLYFPETIPQLPREFWQNINQYSDVEIAYRIMMPYVGETLDEESLRKILDQTLRFTIPLVRLKKNIYILELFHGPTLAFKDLGAKFMSLCLSEFAKGIQKKMLVLVATSGDTGGAVAQSFHKVENIDVLILYPSGKVSAVQEKQLAAMGDNIHTLEVRGDFDDCQALVKQAFGDEGLREKIFLTSANSINVARWLPQQIYYALAWKQFLQAINHSDDPDQHLNPFQKEQHSTGLTISVPSGNFGNICAGILLQRSGLPVNKFIAATNANDVIPEYFQTGELVDREARATISNAMDVARPSNFSRVMEIFGNDVSLVRNVVHSTSTTDEETRAIIKKVYEENNYVMDPHTAVAYHALEKYQQEHPGKGIVLSTAHPVKFPEVVEKQTAKAIDIPSRLVQIMKQPLKKTVVDASYMAIKKFIVSM